LMEQVDDALDAQGADAVRIGAVLEEETDRLAFEGLGLDDGGGDRQVGVGLFETPEVDHGAGPDAVELALDVDADGFELTRGLASEEDVLVETGGLGIGEHSRGTVPLLKQAGDGEEGNGVGVAGTEGQLLALQLGLVGVDEAVEHAGLGALGEVGGEVGEDVVGPVLVVDAGGLVSGDDEIELVAGEVGEDRLLPIGVA